MPDLGGLELQSALSMNGRHPSIVFITGQGDVRSSVRAMKAGAIDFLVKPFDESDLLAAVQAATERERVERLSQTEAQALKARADTLTKREAEVMIGVVAGRLNKQIAANLSIAVKTVKVHRQRVMEKMQAGSLAELVRMAQRLDNASI
jgi:FixJ family two-component response regulator